jgi:hypothetical protein
LFTGVGEVEVLDDDRPGADLFGVVDDAADGVADSGVAGGRRQPGQV